MPNIHDSYIQRYIDEIHYIKNEYLNVDWESKKHLISFNEIILKKKKITKIGNKERVRVLWTRCPIRLTCIELALSRRIS